MPARRPSGLPSLRVMSSLVGTPATSRGSSLLDAHLHPALEAWRLAQRAGRMREAEQRRAEWAGTARCTSTERGLAAWLTVDLFIARGDRRRAMAVEDDVADLLADDSEEGATGRGLAHLASGDLWSALGEQERAVEHHLAAGAAAPGADAEVLCWRLGAALSLVRLGRPAEAAEHAAEQRLLVEQTGSGVGLAAALRVHALVSLATSTIPALEQARALVPGDTATRLAAQIDADLAAHLSLSADLRDRARAVDLLRGAEEYAAREGLDPLQARVRGLLSRLGEEPRRHASEAVSSLTQTEVRVATLAAEGHSNRQIAEKLVVTVKAIEWHLSHVYRKLGIRSRAELAPTLLPRF